MLRLRVVIAAVAVLPALGGGAGAAPPTPPQRLAVQFARAAARVIDVDTLTVPAIDAASSLVGEALSLDPDNAELWRFAKELASLADREAPYEEAVGRLVQLDPLDDAARLLRLNLALERYDTVEERIEAYRRLLTAEQRAKLGPAVASRLALDLALLLRRNGDLEGFSEALSDAVTFDRSNRAAAAIAAGFFRMNVEDPYGQAELLVNLMLADPTDITTQIALAELLLEHGAYAGAERLYQLATRNQFAARTISASGLLADQAIAQWANGHAEAALATIRKRQKQVDDLREGELFSEQPELDPRERAEQARQRALIDPTLATVRAAIQTQRGAEEAPGFVKRALEAYATIIDRAETAEDSDAALVARLELEMAWVAVWLGGELAPVESLLSAAERYQPLSDAARARFEGWLALRRGETAAAVELLRGPAETDPAAGLGLAEAYLQTGRRQDAARVLLEIARARPGSLIEVWAANKLAELVGRRLPLSEQAQRLEALIASIPPAFDRYPETSTLAVGLRIEPAKVMFHPYEPIIINVEITNNSPDYPLAIDRDGPIRPQLVLEFSTTLPATVLEGISTTAVIDIGRRLRLEPRERLVIPIDLRYFQIGNALDTQALHGTLVRVKATLNSVVTPRGAIEPTLLGSEQWTSVIRIEGARVTSPWLRAVVNSIREPDSSEDLVSMALLSHLIGPPRSQAEYEAQQRMPAGQVDLFIRAGDALTSAFASLDDVSQAWLLSVTPPGKVLGPVREMVRESDERLLQLAYMLFHVVGPDDPVLQVALQSSDDHLRSVAETYHEMFKRMSEGAQGPPPPAVPGQPIRPE